MSLSKTLTSAILLASAIVAHAGSAATTGVTQKDFTGIGHIFVLESDDWTKADPKQKVGCLNNNGSFVKEANDKDCGVFTRLDDYPYTLSTKSGNCTFTDETAPTNNDSIYGKGDHAWSCNPAYTAIIYDELYTINGFPHPFLCFGDIACYYDAKTVPKLGDTLPLWQFHWGSQQLGITPGHVQLLLVWDKIGDSPKREAAKTIPSPRIELMEGMQVPLKGQQIGS